MCCMSFQHFRTELHDTPLTAANDVFFFAFTFGTVLYDLIYRSWALGL